MATRKTFSEDHDDAGASPEPGRRNYNCKAYGCEMPGTIDGVCSYHWSAHSGEWQRVTGALMQCRFLVREINAARRALGSQENPDLLVRGHLAAMERIQGQLTQEQLDFLDEKPAHDLRSFAYRLEMLVGHAVQKVLVKRREEKPRQQVAPPPARRPADIYDEMFP